MPLSASLLRLHLLLLLAFLLFYALKAALLFLSQDAALRGLRARTRLADSSLTLLVIGTGLGWGATYPGAAPGWLWVELALVCLLLPLAVAALRRQYKPGIALALLALLYVYGVAQTGSLTLRRPALPPAATATGLPETTATPDDTDQAPPAGALSAEETVLLAEATASGAAAKPTGDAVLSAGQALFLKNCAVCHGPDGRLGRNGAHDLSKSNLNTAGRVYLVTQGLGKMPSFKDQLTADQIEQVAAYSLTLK